MFCTVWLCLHLYRVFFPSLLCSHWPPCWLRNTKDFFSIRSFGFSMSLPGCSSCQTHFNQVSAEMLSPPTQPVWNKYFLQTAQRQITFIPLFFVVHCGSHYHLKLYHLCADSSTVRRRRQWQPTPALLPGKSHGWGSLVGCSGWGHGESDTTKRFHLHTLEKEMATHSSVLAWRIPGMGEPGGLARYGVAQNRTWLKWLSSSSHS